MNQLVKMIDRPIGTEFSDRGHGITKSHQCDALETSSTACFQIRGAVPDQHRRAWCGAQRLHKMKQAGRVGLSGKAGLATENSPKRRSNAQPLQNIAGNGLMLVGQDRASDAGFTQRKEGIARARIEDGMLARRGRVMRNQTPQHGLFGSPIERQVVSCKPAVEKRAEPLPDHFAHDDLRERLQIKLGKRPIERGRHIAHRVGKRSIEIENNRAARTQIIHQVPTQAQRAPSRIAVMFFA